MIKILREDNKSKQRTVDCIKGITLLSAEEAEDLLPQKERVCRWMRSPQAWWLRTPSRYQGHETFVDKRGAVFYDGTGVGFPLVGIRPALILNPQCSNLRIGSTFKFGEYRFKVISEKYALCEKIMKLSAFRREHEDKDANVYEKSDVKKYIDKWFSETAGVYKGIKTDDMIADEMDLGF